jgi:hypothetical protein
MTDGMGSFMIIDNASGTFLSVNHERERLIPLFLFNDHANIVISILYNTILPEDTSLELSVAEVDASSSIFNDYLLMDVSEDDDVGMLVEFMLNPNDEMTDGINLYDN